MPTGFQAINDNGTFQIDGEYPQFVLRHKYDVHTTNERTGDNSGSDTYFYGFVTVYDDEILAIRSSGFAAVVSKQGNTTMIMARSPNALVECYVFGQVFDVGSHFGMQVFNSTGTLVFDSAQKILAMVGFVTGEGWNYYQPGRKYAAICCNQSLVITEDYYSAGGFDYRTSYASRGGIFAVDGALGIFHQQYWKFTEDLSSGYNVQAIVSTVPNRHIVIDVTNY
jgi:hypothetical protein